MSRLFSWISEPRGCDTVLNAEIASKMAFATRPVVEIPGAKRKRSSSSVDLSDSEGTQEVKRLKVHALAEHISEEHAPSEAEAGIDGRVGTESKTHMDPSRIRETLDSEFSLEILLKHQELRLINQELAKCQVALEQLRRCHLIPYPTTQATPESMSNISEGTGSAVWRSGEVPQWAPAFGVADGPYTRHYAKWLIPDPHFDGTQFGGQRGYYGSRAGQSSLEGRSTRHSIAEGMPQANKSRRTSGKNLQALPSNYAAPKEKAGPLVIKRADGQMVKLECVDCFRSNFSSVQGFINHCRIAHKREFKSHEEAANVSGQPIEVDETSSAPVVEERTPITTNGLVHPLIYTSSPDKSAYTSLLKRIEDSKALFLQGAHPRATTIPTSSTSTPIKLSKCTQAKPISLIPSAVTPHLSTWMESRGLGGDLLQSVDDAKKQSELDDLSSPEDDDSEEDVRPFMTPSRHLGGLDGIDSSPPTMRVPARATMSPAPFKRPGSSKGIDIKNARKPGISPRLANATPVINTAAASHHNRPSALAVNDFGIHTLDPLDHSPPRDVDIEMMDSSSSADLSPHTITSNNAPSLVSDDGEYDEGDDAESASSEGEDDDSVAEIDIEDEQVVPRTVLRDRAGSGGDSSVRLRKEDKHVTFVSPVKESGKERRRN